MKTTRKFFVLILLVSVSFTSCKKDEPEQEEELEGVEAEVTLSRETDYGDEDWIYFSFATGEEVAGVNAANYQSNSSWDIAFNRQNVRTNGGTSGTGSAEVKDLGEIDFDTVSQAPENDYTADTTIQIIENIDTMPPPMMSTTGSTVFVGGITFTGPPPAFTPNNHIYCVKTADGKYAKIWLKSFYNDASESGYMTFKYYYQPDGSRNFD